MKDLIFDIFPYEIECVEGSNDYKRLCIILNKILAYLFFGVENFNEFRKVGDTKYIGSL